MNKPSHHKKRNSEIEELRARLEEAEEMLHAIRSGEVDALLVTGSSGAQVFTLESAEQPYRILIEKMQEGAVTLSDMGTILYCNLRFAQMICVPHEKVVASPILNYVSPECVERLTSLLQKGASHSARAEISFRTQDGASLPTFIAVSPLPGVVEGCICMIVTDLTELESLRRNQAKIEELNERLQQSITETHHRVKNNLQIIAAMIDMQVMDGESALPIAEFIRLGHQVRTLAVVHDLLTAQAKADAQAQSISARALLHKLIPLLQEMAGDRRIRTELDDTELSARQGTSLALITNELVSNALKHGTGEVTITFQVNASMSTLEVCDNGPGFPPDFDLTTTGTTGLALVANLSRWDLGGSAHFENRPQGGARVLICLAQRLPAK